MIKKVNFEKLTIENFLSIGKKPVEVQFKKGLHVITGKNRDQADRRNGIGKSTILDALSFCLFGTTLRELKKEFVINNITKKTSKVSLVFTVVEGKNVNQYEVHRTIDPNKCFLYENGVDVTRDSMVNTTDHIQKLVKLTPEVFQNCIAMTLNNTVPFMAKKKIEKRKFIESIFNLEIFSQMNSNLKLEILEAKKELDIKNAKLEEIKNYYNALEVQNNNKIKDKNQKKETYLKRILDNEIESNNLNKKVDNFQTIDISSINEKVSLADNKVNELTGKINSVGKEISTIETKRDFTRSTLLKIGTDKDACPVCLKPVTQDDKNHIKEKKNILKQEIQHYDSQIKVLEEKLSIYEQSKTKLKDAIYKLKEIVNKQHLQNEQIKHFTQKIKDLQNYNKIIKKDLEELEKEDNNFITVFDEQKNKLNDIAVQVEEHRNNLNILDYVKFVLSEDGVRSYIVKKILHLFNTKLSFYLRKLNSNAYIKFDEFFEESIFNAKGVETSYFNYSGAEKKTIDLAIMFTFIEMLRLQSNVIYNVQFYDELLDTSLDEAGVELVVSLLNEIVNTNNYGVYIISHRKECSRLSTGDIIYLEKRNGITQRLPYEG
jgi:DNA repair exonuclease SbcCD ATPase subunit